MLNTRQVHLGSSENRSLVNSFKTSSQLTKALKKEKVLPDVKQNFKSNGKTFIEKYYKEEEIKKKFGAGQQKFTMASEVKSLSYLQKITYNQGTRKMIR